MQIKHLEECSTTAGAVATVAQPFKAVQERSPAKDKPKGSNLLKGIKTSKKFANSVAEGAKVDRMVSHIKSSEKKLGKSSKEAENIAWATANKRGMLDNKNKKKGVAEGSLQEFDPGEGGFGPFKLFKGDRHRMSHIGTYKSLQDAEDELEFQKDLAADEGSVDYYKIIDGTGEQVGGFDPDASYDAMRSSSKIKYRKSGEQGMAEGSEIAVDRKTGKVYNPNKELDKLLSQHKAQFQGMAAIEKAQAKKKAPEKKGVAEGYRDRRDAYQRDYDNSVAGMGQGRSDKAGFEMDAEEWYIVKDDGKLYKTTVFPNQVKAAIAQGYSRTREEAKAKFGLEEGRFIRGPHPVTGQIVDYDRQGNPKEPKVVAPKAPRAPVVRRDSNGLSRDDYQKVWRKIEEVVGQIFPDGDPIDWIAPWLKKSGIEDFHIGEVLDKACKLNGYKDRYAYYDHFKTDDYGYNELAEDSEPEGHTVKNSLHTIIRVATHLEKALSDKEDFPECVSEKVGSVKDQMVTIMNYLISDHEQKGMTEGTPTGMRWYKPRHVPNQNELDERMVMGASSDASSAGSKVQGEAKKSGIMKGIQSEGLGLPYPGTYEQETAPFKHKGKQERVTKIAFEGEKNAGR